MLIARAEERLRADGEPTARITPIRRTPDVAGPREDIPEVAFDSSVRHDADTDDLY